MDMLIPALNRSLSEPQLVKLNAFLSTPFAEAKPMTLTQAHGFLCAILSAPNLIMPSQWQPVLFGGEPEFNSMEEAQEIIGTLMQLNNQTSRQLRGEEKLELLLWEQNKNIPLSECSFELLAEWCKGYLQGAQLDPLWCTDKEAITLLLPFGVLANQFDLRGDKDADGNIIHDDMPFKKEYKNHLLEYIEDNYYYWEDYRNNPMPIYDEQEPYQRMFVKVGRNDPCPCGSGKKYKKCCIDLPIDLH